MKDKYHLFNALISELLYRSSPIDYGCQAYIELLYKATFGDDFLLQLSWENNVIHWYRTTWLKEKDRELVALWFDYAEKGETLPLDLSLKKEIGQAKTLIIKDLIEKIKSLSLKPMPTNEQKGRDGEEIILTIGAEGISSTFAWCTASTPIEWHQLAEALEFILRINKLLN
jgi:hypothetical protein